MNNSWFRIKSRRAIAFGCLFMLFLILPVSSTAALPDTTISQNKYDRRVRQYRSTWNRIIPTYSKIQYAGGMGLLNFGLGWSYGKYNQWETDLFLGFIPRYTSDEAKTTFTFKQNYIPWNKPLNKWLHIEPLSCSLYLNTVFNDEFWTKEPDRYPTGYYGFSTRVRLHLAIGQRLQVKIPHDKRRFSKSFTFFYEVSTCDLYLISAVTNHLKPKDFLRLSFGVKNDIF